MRTKLSMRYLTTWK